MARNKRRTGFSLIEMMLVISVTGVLITLTTFWLHETMKFSSRIRNHQRQHSQLTRLSRNLRTDVRMGQSISVENGTLLTITQSDGQKIAYEISGTTINYKKTVGSVVHQEQYRLNDRSIVKWDVDSLPESIGLIVTRPNQLTPSDSTDNRELEIAQDPDSLPIDIHVFARVKRWPTNVLAVNQKGERDAIEK